MDNSSESNYLIIDATVLTEFQEPQPFLCPRPRYGIRALGPKARRAPYLTPEPQIPEPKCLNHESEALTSCTKSLTSLTLNFPEPGKVAG